MKRHTTKISLLSVILIALVIYSCTKIDLNRDRNNSKPFSVSEAKEWWYGTFRKSDAYLAMDTTSPFYPKPKSFSAKEHSIKQPSWQRAKQYSYGRTIVIEFPLVYRAAKMLFFNKDRLTNVQLTKLMQATLMKGVILHKPNGSNIVYTVSVIPDWEYAQSHHFDISSFDFQNPDSSFSGWILTRTWDEKILTNYRVEKNKKIWPFKINQQTIPLKDIKIKVEAMGIPWWRELNNDFAATGNYECTDWQTGNDEPHTDANCKEWKSKDGEDDSFTFNFDDIPDPEDLEDLELCDIWPEICENDDGDGGGGGGYDEPPPPIDYHEIDRLAKEKISQNDRTGALNLIVESIPWLKAFANKNDTPYDLYCGYQLTNHPYNPKTTGPWPPNNECFVTVPPAVMEWYLNDVTDLTQMIIIIYHEMIHVKQNNKKLGYYTSHATNDDDAEQEFEAYYKSSMDSRVPPSTKPLVYNGWRDFAYGQTPIVKYLLAESNPALAINNHRNQILEMLEMVSPQKKNEIKAKILAVTNITL
jgi:hypothetical protein